MDKRQAWHISNTEIYCNRCKKMYIPDKNCISTKNGNYYYKTCIKCRQNIKEYIKENSLELFSFVSIYKMESELTACLFECYFDDADYEFKDINDMSLKQLVIYKKQLLELQGGNKLTKKQKEIFNGKFKEDVWNEYPSTLYNATELEAEFDKKMRLLEFKKYKEVCYKINNNLFNDSKDMILKIEELEIELKEKSETKYKANHKVFMMERITCKCGMESIRSNLSHHKKSKFHLIYESNIAKVAAEKLTKIQAKQKQNQIRS